MCVVGTRVLAPSGSRFKLGMRVAVSETRMHLGMSSSSILGPALGSFHLLPLPLCDSQRGFSFRISKVGLILVTVVDS